MNQASEQQIFEFCDLKIPIKSFQQSLRDCLALSKESPVRIFWINAHAINISEKNQEFKEALQQAEILLNDGIAIDIASKILKPPLQENLNGTDWIPAFLDYLQSQNSHSPLFLLGSKKDVIEKTVAVFQKRWPNLPITGYHDGYFSESEAILQAIEKAHPRLLIVGMGVPVQELFVTHNWERLKKAGIRMAICGGAIFDFITESVPRAPQLIRTMHLEWAFRLMIEPSRMFSRYIIGAFAFLKIMTNQWLKKKKNDES